MIFENYLTEQDIMENFIKGTGEERGFIFKAYYNEGLILNNLRRGNDNIINEDNIDQDLLSIPKIKRQDSRFVMITGASTASHPGRMKVSAPGERIRRNNKNNYISIYRKDKTTINCEGKLSDINMNNKEYKLYINLFLRNEDLIQFARYDNGMYSQFIDAAFINDEKLRRDGYIVKRDRNTGAVAVYYNNKLLYTKNIGGE